MNWGTDDHQLEAALGSLDVESLIAQRRAGASYASHQPSPHRPPPPNEPHLPPSPPPHRTHPASAQPFSSHQPALTSARGLQPPHSSLFHPTHHPFRSPAPPSHASSYHAPSPTRPQPSSALPLPAPPPSSSSPPPRRSVPSPSQPRWLNASSSASSLFPPPPPPPAVHSPFAPSSGYQFTRRSDVAGAAAAAKADKAAAVRARRRSQRPSARQQARRAQGESPFLDKQLSAFVVRELQVKEEEWKGSREVDGGRFVFLHNLLDRTGEVGHSTFCDLYVHAVQQLQEGKLVPREQRTYIGFGVERGKEERTKKRKRKTKSSSERERGDDELDEAVGASRGSLQQQRQRLRRLSEGAEAEEDEDAPLQPQRSSPASGARRTAMDDDEEEPRGQLQLGDDEEDLPIVRDVDARGVAQQRPQPPSHSIADFFQQPARERRSTAEDAPIWVEEDEQIGGSLPGPSPPSPPPDPVARCPIPRPPSPLVDFPLEPLPSLPPSAAVNRREGDHLDPLVRHLAGFVLDDGAQGDALMLPRELFFTTPPSLTPASSLTPPKPPSSALATAAPSLSSSGLIAASVLPSSAASASSSLAQPRSMQSRVEPLISPSRPIPPPSTAASTAPPPGRAPCLGPMGSAAPPLSAAERKAIAEAKRQRWLQEQQGKAQSSSIRSSSRDQQQQRPTAPPLHVTAAPSSALPSLPLKDDSWMRPLHDGDSAWRYPIA